MDLNNTIENNDFVSTEPDFVSKDINDFPILPQEAGKMLTSAESEIVIDLTINLLSKNSLDHGHIPDNKQIYNNNYWIPVPSGANADEYTIAFIRHFEKSMATSLINNSQKE
jgi:hypothetical protein